MLEACPVSSIEKLSFHSLVLSRCVQTLITRLQPFTMGETPGKMYALATVLTLLAVVAVLLRLYARKIKNAILAWDDYLIIVALVR